MLVRMQENALVPAMATKRYVCILWMRQTALQSRTSVTVKHILTECVDFNDVRNKRFVASSIRDLFENVEAQNII